MLTGCVLPRIGATDAMPCWPSFPYQEGWLGGDAAYSVPLSESETLWLFGDTFVGAPGSQDRRGAAFVHNSIGLSRCLSDGRWEIAYAWGRGADGSPRAFLDRGETDAWWWLFDGFLHDGRLYLGLLEVESAPPSGPLQTPFAFTGVQLARVRNPREAPKRWQVEEVVLAPTPGALPASTMVRHGAHVYLFTFLDRGDGHYPRALARLPLIALDGSASDVSGSLEYLDRDGAWRPGLDPERARILMADTASEMSVAFHPGLRRWLAVYSYPVDSETEEPVDAVWLRSAEQLEGPWSERRLLFRAPELHPDWLGGHDPDTRCYAAKAHPQLSHGRNLVLTYVCNLFTPRGGDANLILSRLLVDMDLYRPVPVVLDLPPHLFAAP